MFEMPNDQLAILCGLINGEFRELNEQLTKVIEFKKKKAGKGGLEVNRNKQLLEDVSNFEEIYKAVRIAMVDIDNIYDNLQNPPNIKPEPRPVDSGTILAKEA